MSTTPRRVDALRRALVIGLVLVLLALAGFANATIKRHRAATGAGPSAAVSAAETGEDATSTAWYCAGPLPLGLRSERSRIAIANVSDKTVRGELLVATETGLARAEHVTVAAHDSVAIALASPGHSAFGAATVLLDAAGIGVQELVTGPTGSDASPCVSHASVVQYLPGGATKDGSTVDLAIFDPGATPSVASVSFATPTGRITPPAFQQMPIEAGQTLVLDVGRYLPVQPLIATTVTAAGGHVVAGTIASDVVDKTTFPALVSASAVPETTWYFGPSPSGPGARQGFIVLNPGSSTAQVALNFIGSSGRAQLSGVVPPGGLLELAPPPDKSLTGSRWASINASQPVVVTRETVLGATAGGQKSGGASHALSHAASGGATVPTTIVPALVTGFPQPLPSGFALTPGSLVLSRSWLLAGGVSNARGGELITVANPATTRATVQFGPLQRGAPRQSVVIGPRGSVVLQIASLSGAPGGVALALSANVPIVAGAALYARGPNGSLGFSAPGAIPVD